MLPAIGLWAALALWLWFGPWQGLGPPDNPFLVWGSLAHLGEGHGGLFWTGFDPQSPSGFLSEPHRIEWLNLVLFQVPQVLGLCAIGLGLHRGGARLDAPRRGLLWLATGAIAVSLLDRPFGGHLVQWAHNTGLATAGGLLAAGLWSIYDNDDTWRWGCAALLGLGLYRTVGFVVLNHLAPPF